MELKEYQQLALRTINKDLPELNKWEIKAILLYTGIAGESGELIDLFKKAIFHKHGLDRDKVRGEIGDLVWYIVNLASHFGIDMSEVLQLNIDKLNIRYPDGFSTENSISRVDVIQFKDGNFDYGENE